MFRLKNKKQRENSLIVMRAISRIKKYEMNAGSYTHLRAHETLANLV